MEIPFHYVRKAILFVIAALFFWLVYNMALPDAGSSIGATFFAAFGAFVATSLCMTIFVILLGVVQNKLHSRKRPYLQKRLITLPQRYNGAD